MPEFGYLGGELIQDMLGLMDSENTLGLLTSVQCMSNLDYHIRSELMMFIDQLSSYVLPFTLV